MKLKYIFPFGLFMLLAACSPSLEEHAEWGVARTPSFTAKVVSDSSETVSGFKKPGEKIGIYMTAGEKILFANAPYETGVGGKLSPLSQALSYPEDGRAVNFSAYYPYNAALSDGALSLDFSKQSDYAKLNLLYAGNAKGKKGSSSPKVLLQFQHPFSLLKLQITFAHDKPAKDLKINILGQKTQVVFNLLNGTYKSSSSIAAAIPMNVDMKNKEASAVLLPSSNPSSLAFEFEIDGKKIIKTLSVSALPANRKISVPVNFDDSEQPSVQFGAAIIEKWMTERGKQIDVDFGGGAVTPPSEQTEVSLLEENFGNQKVQKEKGRWPYLSAYNDFISGKTFTDVNKTLSVRNWSENNCIWFPAAKNNELQITGFQPGVFKKFILTYELNANLYNANDEQDLSAMKGSFADQEFSSPSIVISHSGNDQFTFKKVKIELQGAAVTERTRLVFSTSSETNQKGIRLAKIKLVGEK